MPQQTNTPSITERATRRYKFARDALEGMYIDLVILAERAMQVLLEQEGATYSEVIASTNQKKGSPLEAAFRTAKTWDIPGAQFFLPNWQEEGYNGDFFETTRTFEYTLVKKTEEGFELITFEAFVKECTLAEYISVCEGLDDLANLSLQTASGMGDGQEN